MEQFGLEPGAHMLEPSMGVRHFFGLMPERLYPATRRSGVELDSISARIAAILYRNRPFIEALLKIHHFPRTTLTRRLETFRSANGECRLALKYGNFVFDAPFWHLKATLQRWFGTLIWY
jgi:hypothetical protein